MNFIKPIRFSALASLAALAISAAVPADAHGQEPGAAPESPAIRPAVAELDRMLIDARRQLELMATAGELVKLVEQIQPWGDSVLVLLDESRPMAERWRKVLAAPPAMAIDPGPAELLRTDSPELEQELRMLRDRVEIMDAQLAVLGSAGALPPVPLPLPEQAAAEEDPALALQERIGNWRLNADAVRYAQAGRAGVQPAVWLDSPVGGARLAVGSSMRIGDRALHLDRLDRQRDGRIRMLFRLDGQPVSIDW